jgi:nanoRNase/pAp phosphatase (c-di-AMP/oligoRNAs hydrolase)
VAVNGKAQRTAGARLLSAIKEARTRTKSLLILTHDHPDPDALASAWALALLCQKVGKIRARIAYGGAVGRRENIIMLEALRIPAMPLKKSDLEAKALAAVDTQPPFKNNHFPPKRRAEIIIDHHPRHAETRGEAIIIDEGIGATSTLLVEALLEAELAVPARLATALVYGISSETQNLGREACARDRTAYMALLPKTNMRLLWRMANPPRPSSFFQNLARGINNAFVCRRVIGVHLREIFSPDRVAQMADFLLTHEKMMWSIVTGRYAGRLHVSLRTHSQTENAGKLLRRLLGGKNRAGGHRMIAGGSLEVGQDASEEAWKEAESTVVAAFLKSRSIADPESRTFPFRMIR